MKVSYIIPVLNSHEAVRRQILFWERMNLPDDVEIIIMDDGSDPPLQSNSKVVTIHPTNETTPWTSSIARNRGAEIARGRNLLMADLDYIIPESVFLRVRDFTGIKMHFRREFGVLDEHGQFTQDRDVLLKYGLLLQRYRVKGAYLPPHPNVFAMRRDVFFAIGGYDEDRVRAGPYPQREDNQFKRDTMAWLANNPHRPEEIVGDKTRSTVYMFPNGQFCGDVDYNPFGLFHDLSRKNQANVYWQRQKARDRA